MSERSYEQPITIINALDSALVQKKIEEAVKEIGFNYRQQDDIIFGVEKLVSHVVEYATHSSIRFEHIFEGEKEGIQINVSSYGLRHFGVDFNGINQRFDGFEIGELREGPSGIWITAKKWLNKIQDANWQDYFLDTGAVTHAKPGEEYNGDAYYAKSWEGKGLIAVIDGLGHGEQASKAADSASGYIQEHAGQTIGALFKGVNQVCQATHGVVMAIAQFDWRLGKLTFASIGNIEAKVLKQQEKVHLPAVRGFIGRIAPVPKVVDIEWNPDWILVLHSDGVSKNWQSQDFAYLFDKRAQMMAEHMYQKLHLEHDDATVLVAKVSCYEKHQRQMAAAQVR